MQTKDTQKNMQKNNSLCLIASIGPYNTPSPYSAMPFILKAGWYLVLNMPSIAGKAVEIEWKASQKS